MSDDVLNQIRDEFARDVSSAAARAREKLRRAELSSEWLSKRIAATESAATCIETSEVVVERKPRRSR